MSTTRKPKPLAWSHPATKTASNAILELANLRVEIVAMQVKAKNLQEVIVKEGGGRAGDIRAAIHHATAFRGMRMVTRNARDYVTLYNATDGKRYSPS